jgi:hypothetical protein
MKKLVGTIEMNPYATLDSQTYGFTCPNCEKKYDLVIDYLYNGAFRLDLYERLEDEVME